MPPDGKPPEPYDTVAWSQYLLNQAAAVVGELHKKGMRARDIQTIGRALIVAAQNTEEGVERRWNG